jgi:hypothetical protein
MTQVPFVLFKGSHHKLSYFGVRILVASRTNHNSFYISY